MRAEVPPIGLARFLEFPWSAPWRQRLFSCGRSASVHELLAACGSREIPVRGLRISARFLSDSGGASGSPWGLRSAHGGASGSPWVCEVPPRGHCVASRNFRNFLENLGSPGPAACRDSSTGLVKVLRGGRNKTAGGRLEIFEKFQVQGKPPARRHGAARGRPCAAEAAPHKPMEIQRPPFARSGGPDARRGAAHWAREIS